LVAGLGITDFDINGIRILTT